MLIPHRKLSIDINRPNQYTVDFIAHVGDKNTRYIDITFNAGGEPIELEQGCAATVTYVSDGVLIEQAAECDVDGSTVIVGIDTEKVKSLRSGILEIQPKIVDGSGNIIVSQIPVFVRISPDIAEHGRVDDNSLGTYAEVVREIAAARGSYTDLKERLEHIQPTDEQIAEAVEGYLGEHSGEIFNDAIIGNFDILTPDIEFEVTNDDVKNYLTSADYTFAVDYAYNGTDYASTNVPSTIGSAVNERPNGGQIAIPDGGVKLTLYDTVANTKWSVNISGDTYTVKNLIPNRLYTYVITDIDDTVIKTGSCKASGQVRTIDAGKATTYYTTDPSTTFKRPIFNIRDLGGWACDGGRLKYGVIYRGCRLNGNYTSGQTRYSISISPAQIDFFKNFLGIRDEIDFRQVKDDPDLGNTETAGDDAEYETTDDIKDTALGIGVDYTIIPINPYLRGIEIKSDNAEMNRRYANVIKRIARDIEEGKPCYMHCLEGADRTATVAMLILAICGVSRNDIERDYELTSFSKDYAGNRNRRARNDTAQSYRWMNLIQYLLGSAFSGSTFRDKIIDYVLKIGVTIEEINTIRAGLIDGEPEKISNPYADVAITYNLTNINTDNPIFSIPMYQTFEAKLSALNTKSIQNVVVTMGGTDVTSSVYSQEKISIPKVTGDVIITAIASDIDVSGKADKSYVDTELGKKADVNHTHPADSAFSQTSTNPVQNKVVTAKFNEIVSGKANKATTLSGYGITDGQTKIDSSHKLSSDLVDDTDQTNKFVTDTDKTNWNNKLSSANGAVKSSNIDNGAVTTEKLGLGVIDSTLSTQGAAAESSITGASIKSISLNESSQSITLSTGVVINEQDLITGLSIPYGTKIYVKLGFSASSNPVVTGKAVQIRANGKFIVSLNRGAVNNWTEVTLSGQLTNGEIITRIGAYLANDVLSTQTDFILSVRSSIIKSINDNADNISETNAVLQPLGETVNGHLLDYEILPTSNAPTFSGNTSQNDPLIVTLPYFYIRNKSATGTAYTTRTTSNSPFSVGHNEGLFYNLETRNLEVLSVANTPLDTKYILLLWKQITAVKGLWAYIYYDSVLKQDVEGRLSASSGAVKTANLDDGAVTKDKLSEDLSAQIQQISSCKHYTKKIISRQGQGYGYPDNSLEGITAALKDGYRNIRLSVASTSDNVIYCTHSYELSHNTSYPTPVITQNGQPYTQNVVINDVTSEFIDSILYKGYAIPTLDEALKVISLYDADVTLEVKDDFSATAIQNIIDAIKFYSINITLSGLPQQVEPFANVYGGLNLGLIFNYSVNDAATYKARFEGKYKTVRFDCFMTDTITKSNIINNIHPDVKLKLGGSNITAAQAKEYMAYLDVTEYQGKVSDIY